MKTDQFTCHLKEVARDMRNQFAAANCKHMHFSVTVEGVKGNGLEAVLLEFFRRNGRSLQHEPLCLPQVESNEEDVL